jgi:PAS domain S-box-containing protein
VKANALYRELFDSSPDGILLIDAETQGVIEFNDAACRQLGYTREEFAGLAISDYEASQSPNEIKKLVRRALHAGMIQFDTVHRTKTAELRNVHVWVKTFLLDSRVAFHCIFRDITEMTQARQALQDSERMLKESQAIAGLGGYVLDVPTGTWTSSDTLDVIFGIDDRYDRSIAGWTALVHPAWRARMSQYLADDVLERHARFDMEYQIVRQSDGTTHWVHGLGELEVDGQGNPVKMHGTISDITERRQADTALRLQAAALAAAADAIVITDRTGIIEWVNPAFTRLTGYTADEAGGKNPNELVKSGKHDGAFYKELWDTILAKQTWHGEMINRRKDGTLYSEEQSITPILDASGGITHFVAIKEDTTERLKAEAQFRQAQKMEVVGRLASGIAHDFNNLLTVINGISDLVLAQVPRDDPLHADLEEILSAAQRASMLTRQLLAFSRQQIMAPRLLNLSVLLAGANSLLRRILGEDIELVVVAKPGLGGVKADPGQIEQVITNLAVNARDAMPRGGQLTIELQNVAIDADYALDHGGVAVPPGQYVLMAVRDTGEGMDDATRQRIFEPFFTTKGPGKGTGLGLSTAYGIVGQSHGFIRVQSELGRGCTFKIYLPRVAEMEGTDRSGPAVIPGAGTETVLLVEDDAGVRNLATRFLEGAGYTVLGVATGEDALSQMARREEPVHLLLSDVVMPGMSGRLLAEQFARTRPGMKVLYMSGYTSDTMLRHGVSEATVSFLNKPFTAASMLRKVREVLDS